MNGRTPLARAGRAAGIVALLVFSLFPAYWMFTTAIDADAATRGSSLFPTDLTWAHFDRVLDQGGFAVYIRNSVLVATGTVLVSATLEEPHLLVGVVEEVADATGESVARRFGYAFVDSFGTVHPAGPAPYLDCVAAPDLSLIHI